MLKRLRDCALWLGWKAVVVFAAGLFVASVAFDLDGRLLAVLGSTPLLAMLVCVVPLCNPPPLRTAQEGSREHDGSTDGDSLK